MTRWLTALLVVPSIHVLLAPTAAGQTPAQPADTLAEPAVADWAEGVGLSPETSAARVGQGLGVVSVMGGYDAAQRSAVFSAAAEAFVRSRLALRVGMATPSSGAAPQAQVGVRWQFLRQEQGQGADASFGFLYRRDRFTQDSGMFQAVAAAGRTFGRIGTLANLAYGQDDEGDDRLTELRCSAIYRLRDAAVVGLAGSAATARGSTDPRRAARGEAEYELRFGPTGAYVVGSWALLVQGGIDVAKTTRPVGGLFALGGVSTAL
jgi:hypothetical protein